MKKITALLLALLMVLAMGITIFAETTGGAEEQQQTGEKTVTANNATTTQNVTVKVNVATYFEWTVPSEIVMTKGDAYNSYSGSKEITFDKVLLPSGKSIEVTASAKSNFTIGGNTYTLTIGGEDAATGKTTTGTSLTVAASMTATVATDADVSDIVAFAVKVK